MSGTLIDSVKTIFTDTLLARFAVLLGESESNIQKAVHGVIPMVLTDIVHKAYFPEGTAKVATLGRQAANSDFFGHLHELSIDAGGLVAGSALLNKGTDFARNLFATRTDPVIGEVSRHAGISIPSATFITGITCFAALDAVGRHLANTNVDGNGLASWLKTQGDSIVHAIPVGLQVKPALGISHYPWEKPVVARGNTALYIVVSLLVIALILFFFYRSCGRAEITAPTGTRDTTVVAAVPAPAPDSADTLSSPSIKVTLPDGKVLDAYKGGTEDRLVNFLSDPNAKLDKKNGNWFDFTKIGFASNSASLLLESDAQLKNIAAILGAFPKAKIKIGGYSDNTGDSTDNVRLSQQRADNILAKIKELGARSSQLTGSEGYGSNYPVGDNGTASGRAMNRRMSINVKAK